MCFLRLNTWPRVKEFEGQVDFELSAHPRQDELDVDGVGDDGPGQVLQVAGVGPAGGGEGLAGAVSAQAQVAVHGQAPLDGHAGQGGLEDDLSLEGASGAQGAPVLGLQRRHSGRVRRLDHCQLNTLNHTDLITHKKKRKNNGYLF